MNRRQLSSLIRSFAFSKYGLVSGRDDDRTSSFRVNRHRLSFDKEHFALLSSLKVCVRFKGVKRSCENSKTLFNLWQSFWKKCDFKMLLIFMRLWGTTKLIKINLHTFQCINLFTSEDIKLTPIQFCMINLLPLYD